MVFIIKSFQTIVFIFNVIFTQFRPICPPAFFRCLSNSGTYTELRTTSFIESTGVSCCDSVSHNWVKMLRIPVLCYATMCPADLQGTVRSRQVHQLKQGTHVGCGFPTLFNVIGITNSLAEPHFKATRWVIVE